MYQTQLTAAYVIGLNLKRVYETCAFDINKTYTETEKTSIQSCCNVGGNGSKHVCVRNRVATSEMIGGLNKKPKRQENSLRGLTTLLKRSVEWNSYTMD